MRKRIDSVVRAIVKDIVYVFKTHKNGDFELPEDISDEEMVYDFDKLPTTFSVTLSITNDDSINTVDIDGNYYDDEDVIEIMIVTNPNKHNELIYELIGELNELIRHELEHLIQVYTGYIFPDREPEDPKEYYTQKHELQALKKGFKRKSKVVKKNYELLIRDWFEKNEHKHNLSQKDVGYVIDRILTLN